MLSHKPCPCDSRKVSILIAHVCYDCYSHRNEAFGIDRHWCWDHAVEFTRWQHRAVGHGARLLCLAPFIICYASLTLARILFSQYPAVWRAKSCHCSGTKSARWRTVCAISCTVSSVTHKLRTVHDMRDDNFVVVTSRDTLEINFWRIQNVRPIWHALLHLTRIATHPHAPCHEFFPHWHAKLRVVA